MKLWKTIIIDDEPLARLELKRLLVNYSQIEVVAEADSVPSAKEKIEAFSPDLLFLDIDLGNHSGFDLLEKFPKRFQVIFVTAYEEFAIRAFQVNALDYLLKPVHPTRLKDSIDRLGNPFSYNSAYSLKAYDKILIDQFNCSSLINVNEISYIQAQGDYSMVYTSTNKNGLMHHTLKKWMDRLPNNMFKQVHRSFIVNIEHIERLIRKENNTYDIVLPNQESIIPVSRRFSKNIRDSFKIS